MSVYLSENVNKNLLDYLKSKGFEIIFVTKHADVQDGVASHPDIYFCSLPDGTVYEGDASLLAKDYPGDVLYNACVVGKYFICSKHTSKDLYNLCTNKYGLKPVVVPQGYVKCNLCIIDDTHVITEDEGIAMALKDTSIECLQIERGFVELPGYKYGFIGGASGRVDEEIIFNGDLSTHPDYKKIADFIKSCNLFVKYFDSYRLTDIGSILVKSALNKNNCKPQIF